MKKLIALVLALLMALSLAACSKSAPPAETPAEEPAAEEESSGLTAEDIAAAAAEEGTEEEEEELLFEEEVLPFVDWTGVNPLTGEPTPEDVSRQRPVLVMLNDVKAALPQSGPGQADIIYEMLEEGGVTRMMAVYQDITKVQGNLGSIRSTRPYYVDLVAGLDGILVHAGGSKGAYNEMGRLNVDDIDGVKGGYTGLFWRDQARRDAGIAIEHTMFITVTDIVDLISSGAIRSEHKDTFSMHQIFAEDGTPTDGSDANIITVPFSSYKTGVFTYDEELGKYLVSQYGNQPYMDATLGEQVSVENVLIIMTEVKTIEGDSKGRQDIDMTGTGIGYFACGGKYIPINWSRNTLSSEYVFTTMDGQQLTLGVGNSYVNIVPTYCALSFVG